MLRRRSALLGAGSQPVGRVLCPRSRGAAVIHLGLPLPTASCGLPASIGRAALDRSRREPGSPLDLAPGGVYRAAAVTCGAGGHYTTLSPLPRVDAGAVCSLWHCPAGHPGLASPTTLPCGARTFLTGLAPGATARPTHPCSGYAEHHRARVADRCGAANPSMPRRSPGPPGTGCGPRGAVLAARLSTRSSAIARFCKIFISDDPGSCHVQVPRR